ncbi:hypothetical protein [Paracoccus yeei]|uniref:Uncharacterized protein n=1 Tax=Paracoccus yeei TaxID=147645 RepID=A0A5P2QNY1_9RHOB|nr:hypothetical protein [Paracoccus yeei]QEU07323.1 hypothetical protein FOB51_04395 [Paracoccus yeei]
MMVDRKMARRERDARDAQRGQMGRDRFNNLAGRIVEVIRQAFISGETASVFGLEGPLRAGIRADLCRQGWRWRDADDEACSLLHEAFLTLRAERPNWEEGQASWAVSDDVLVSRTLCVNCGGALPEGHYKFCGDLCASAHHHALNSIKSACEGAAYDKVVKFYRRRYG